MTKKIESNTHETPQQPLLAIHSVMPRCSTCKFWEQNTFYNYEDAVNNGLCSELGSELTIELKTGWDGGYVDSIETKSSFGCVFHNCA